MASSSKRISNLNSTFEKAGCSYSISAPPVNGKNKLLTLLSQTRINGSVNLKGHKKIENQPRRLFWPRYIHLCHQKSNLARQKVPVNM
jgi:hypothetical protein